MTEDGSLSIQSSLRQYDLDQVMRVERFTLLSARAFTGTPFNCVTIVILLCAVVNLADAPPPFLLHLQFTGAGTWLKREEIC